VIASTANVHDGTQLIPLIQQHLSTTGLPLHNSAVAADSHYGTATNYIYCIEEGIRPHLGEVSANVEEKGKFSLTRFFYEPEQDRLRCPQGHYLVPHQHRPQEQLTVYLIEDSSKCANCPLRQQCTLSERGRSIQRHDQAELIQAAQQEAKSPAGRHSRKRRQHVMEGSFADAANNHGIKKARWRGLGRQRIQSFMIAAVQNLRILMKKMSGTGNKAAVGLGSESHGTDKVRILSPEGGQRRPQRLDSARLRLTWLILATLPPRSQCPLY
jgi:hypothetical protein